MLASIQSPYLQLIAALRDKVKVDATTEATKRLRLAPQGSSRVDFALIVPAQLAQVRWILPVDLEAAVLRTTSVAPNNVHAKTITEAHIPGYVNTPAAPCMLLNELGSRPSKGRALDKRKLMVLFAPSGAGKTRKVFEMLHDEFGLYLVCKSELDKNFGSLALLDVVGKVTSIRSDIDWSVIITEETKSKPSVYARRDAVHELVDCVVLSYVEVFKAWSTWLSQNHPDAVLQPKHWLFAQLFPSLAFGDDIFASLAKELAQTCTRPLPSSLQSSYKKWPVVVDEAQLLHNLLQNQFLAWLTPDASRTRSLLSPVCEEVTKLVSRTILVATGFSMMQAWDDFSSGVESTSPNPDPLFADFELLSEDEVARFLRRSLNTDSQDVVSVAKWLAGRPRFVNTFVKRAVIANSGIDALMPAYLATCFDETEERSPAAALHRLESTAGHTLGGKPALNAYFSFLTDTLYLSFGFDAVVRDYQQLVEFGLAYAVPGKHRSSLVSPEPLLLEAARRAREKHGGDAKMLMRHLTDVQQDAAAMGKVWELLSLPALLDVLTSGNLEDSALFGGHGAALPQTFRGKWTRPAYKFGVLVEKARGQRDVLPWLKAVLSDPATQLPHVFLPDNNAGPDAFIALKHATSPAVLLVAVSDKLRVSDDLHNALLRLAPGLMYYQNRGAQPDVEGQPHQKGMQRVVPGMESDVLEIQQLLAGRPLLRIVLSPTTQYSNAHSVEVAHGPLLPNTGGPHHVLVVVDKRNAGQVLGNLADQLAAIKF
jgi:hypothetical protein